MFNVNVDISKCTGCEECSNICPQEVFKMTDSKSDPYKAADCVGCMSCVEACPEQIITVTEM